MRNPIVYLLAALLAHLVGALLLVLLGVHEEPHQGRDAIAM